MRVRFFSIGLLLLLLTFSANSSVFAQDELSRRVGPAIATVLARGDDGRFEVVGSGVFVRGDGVLLTAYNLVRGARELQVRLANGETYDRAELVAVDERRNVAVLRINALSTPFVLAGVPDESAIGARVQALSNTGGQLIAGDVGALSSISLADEIPGAGTGFRVLKFNAPLTPGAAGGVLVDPYGRALGLIAPMPQAQNQSYAVPLSNVIGMLRAIPTGQPINPSTALVLAPAPQQMNRAVPIWQTSTTPLAPMPQAAVPERPTSPLTPAGPGSIVVRETDPAKLFSASKTLYVVSSSNLFKPVQLVNELRKRSEFADWKISFVDEREVADLILEIEHVPLTWEFPFSIRHLRTGIVIATGKIYAWNGGDGAQLMAARVVEKLSRIHPAAKSEK